MKQRKIILISLNFGITSGVLSGLYGIGALLISYISRTTNSKSEFRANISCVFLIDNTFGFIFIFFIGLLNKEILRFSLFLLPAVIIEMIIGVKVDSNMKDETSNCC